MSMHHINYADKNYAPTHIYQIQSIVFDTEINEENQFSFSTFIQQIFSASSQHFQLNAKLCPIYSPINKF